MGQITERYRGRSKADFFSKICITIEESDESEYRPEVIQDINLSKDKPELLRLLKEANEISKIMTKSKNTSLFKVIFYHLYI